uniref:Uncharacterized protein n=1 Tax=Rhizophora mucronata TaxID=61149 RepID=A0A2P2NUI4_RHIMU
MKLAYHIQIFFYTNTYVAIASSLHYHGHQVLLWLNNLGSSHEYKQIKPINTE